MVRKIGDDGFLNRRDFLQAVSWGIGGGMLGAAMPLAGPTSARSDPLDISASICRVRTESDDAPFVSGTGEGLTYRGTHILTYGALRELGNKFNASHENEITVFGGGCDDGITAVQQGKADFGGMCCPTEGSRAERMAHLLLAKDLKVALVHPDNPVEGLSLAALREIANGSIRRWSDVGGMDRAIALVVRRHCSHFQEPVRETLVGREGLLWSRWALNVDTSEQLVNTVSRFPGAIGVGSWVFAAPLVKRGTLKALPLDGASPTIENAMKGIYNLTGPLSVVYQRWNPNRMAPFLDFLFSNEGREIISQNLVPVSADQAGYNAIRTI